MVVLIDVAEKESSHRFECVHYDRSVAARTGAGAREGQGDVGRGLPLSDDVDRLPVRIRIALLNQLVEALIVADVGERLSSVRFDVAAGNGG